MRPGGEARTELRRKMLEAVRRLVNGLEHGSASSWALLVNAASHGGVGPCSVEEALNFIVTGREGLWDHVPNLMVVYVKPATWRALGADPEVKAAELIDRARETYHVDDPRLFALGIVRRWAGPPPEGEFTFSGRPLAEVLEQPEGFAVALADERYYWLNDIAEIAKHAASGVGLDGERFGPDDVLAVLAQDAAKATGAAS